MKKIAFILLALCLSPASRAAENPFRHLVGVYEVTKNLECVAHRFNSSCTTRTIEIRVDGSRTCVTEDPSQQYGAIGTKCFTADGVLNKGGIYEGSGGPAKSARWYLVAGGWVEEVRVSSDYFLIAWEHKEDNGGHVIGYDNKRRFYSIRKIGR